MQELFVGSAQSLLNNYDAHVLLHMLDDPLVHGRCNQQAEFREPESEYEKKMVLRYAATRLAI